MPIWIVACHGANHSVQKEIDDSFQVLRHESWPLGKMRLLPGPVFPSLGESAHEASGHCSANVGFRIMANHRRILGGAVETFDGKCEECLLASRPEAYSRAATNGPASRLISQSRSRKLRLFANARNAAP